MPRTAATARPFELDPLEARTLLSSPGHAPDVVYVETNNPAPGQNAILAFRRSPADGSLKELPGGPFKTGGTGFLNASERLGPDDSDQELVASPDGRFLFAVNQGSDSVSVFRIRPSGALELVHGAPFASGGTQPVSLAIRGDTLVVLNRGDEMQGEPGTVAPNYTSFHIDHDGALKQIPGATVTLPVGLSPSQGLISPDGRLLFADNFTPPPLLGVPLANTIVPYRLTPDGRLVPAPGGPIGAPADPPLLLGLAAHPDRRILYAGLVGAARIGVYTYDRDGALTFVTAVPDQGAAPCWLVVSPDGQRLYVANSGTDSVAVFSLADPLKPVQIQEFALAGPRHPDSAPGANQTVDFQLSLDPTGRFLYVVNHETSPDDTFPQGNQLHTLRVAGDGTLSEPADSPLLFGVDEVPANAHPQGIVVLGGLPHDDDHHDRRPALTIPAPHVPAFPFTPNVHRAFDWATDNA
jgi:6-phosphogluconolactonase (cycloisomerase 2 family)